MACGSVTSRVLIVVWGGGEGGACSSLLSLTLSIKHIVTNIINDITYYINYHISVYNRNMTTFQFRSNTLLNLSLARLAVAKRP